MPGTSAWGSLSPLSGPSGQVSFFAGVQSGTLTDPRIKTTTVLLTSAPGSADATAFYVKSIILAAGQATITLNAAPTGTVTIGYVIVNPSEIG